MDLGTAVEEFLAELRRANRSANTLRVYRADFRQFLDHLGAPAPDLAAVGRRAIRAWLAVLWDRGLKPHTVRNKLGAVRALFDWAKRHGHAGRNPARDVGTPKVPMPLPRVLNEKETNNLVDGVAEQGAGRRFHARDLLIFELLYGCGLRCGELAGLSLDDVDGAGRTIRVRGKGRVERLVPFGGKVAEALAAYLPVRQAKPGEKALLTSSRRTRITTQAVRNVVKFFGCLIAGDPSIHPHLFRHAYATHLLDNGADLRAIQELLGHASVATTQIYLQVSPRHLMEVYDRAHPKA